MYASQELDQIEDAIFRMCPGYDTRLMDATVNVGTVRAAMMFLHQQNQLLLDLAIKAVPYLEHPDVKSIPFAIPPDAITEDIRKAVVDSRDEVMIKVARERGLIS